MDAPNWVFPAPEVDEAFYALDDLYDCTTLERAERRLMRVEQAVAELRGILTAKTMTINQGDTP